MSPRLTAQDDEVLDHESEPSLDPGEESESDDADVSAADFRTLTIVQADWTVGTLLEQIELAELNISPDFQRRNVWTEIRRSRLIESLMLGIPVPQIILANLPSTSDREAGLIVLDGKQRLVSLAQFMNPSLIAENPLRLTGLRILHDLNGMTASDIEDSASARPYWSALRKRTIRTVIVQGATNTNVLHLVFLRLNTESVRLSPQELRQAEFPGAFTKWVNRESGESEGIRRILNLEEPDFRMRDVELLLRYLSFRYFLENYRGNLKAFLDNSTMELNRNWETWGSRCADALGGLERAIDATYGIFEESSFALTHATGDHRFNRAVFDLMVYFFSDSSVAAKALRRRRVVRESFEELLEQDPRFLRWLQSTTKSKDSTFGRLGVWGKELQQALGVDLAQIRFLPEVPAR